MRTDFTPLTGPLGGLLIGVASIGLLLATGRIAGISGIVAGIFLPIAGDVRWRVAFVAGLPLGAWGVARVAPTTAVLDMTSSKWLLVVAGLLVGLGTQIGNGCTSGHGICGLARRSARSRGGAITFLAPPPVS